MGEQKAVTRETACGEDLPRTDLRILLGLRRILRSVSQHSRRLEVEFGISGAQLAAVVTLEQTEPISQKALADAMGVFPSTVTRIADHLESKGLARRRRDTVDRRRSLLSLTAKGRRVARTAPSPLSDRLRQGLTDLTDARRTRLAESVEELVALLGAEDLDAAPVLAPAELS